MKRYFFMVQHTKNGRRRTKCVTNIRKIVSQEFCWESRNNMRLQKLNKKFWSTLAYIYFRIKMKFPSSFYHFAHFIFFFYLACKIIKLLRFNHLLKINKLKLILKFIKINAMGWTFNALNCKTSTHSLISLFVMRIKN